MTRIALIVALGAACLAGCSGEANRQEGEAVAVRDAARQVDAQGLKPQPGLYKTTITMTGLEIPGLPEGMEGHGAGLARTLESCLTPAEVDKGFDALEPDNLQNDENVSGGKITTQQQIDFNGWVADQAHAAGLAVFQKNGQMAGV